MNDIYSWDKDKYNMFKSLVSILYSMDIQFKENEKHIFYEEMKDHIKTVEGASGISWKLLKELIRKV